MDMGPMTLFPQRLLTLMNTGIKLREFLFAMVVLLALILLVSLVVYCYRVQYPRPMFLYASQDIDRVMGGIYKDMNELHYKVNASGLAPSDATLAAALAAFDARRAARLRDEDAAKPLRGGGRKGRKADFRTALSAGEILKAGEFIGPNKLNIGDAGVMLKMQKDGNLVLFAKYKYGDMEKLAASDLELQKAGKDGNVSDWANGFWSTQTWGEGRETSYLAFQEDGNVVLYDRTGDDKQALWSTGTFEGNTFGIRSAKGGSVAVFEMWNKPALVINDNEGKAIIACVNDGCHVLPHGDVAGIGIRHEEAVRRRGLGRKVGARLVGGQTLKVDDYIHDVSDEGARFGPVVKLERNGNLVLANGSYVGWSSRTTRPEKDTYEATFRENGDFVLRDAETDEVLWSSKTFGGNSRNIRSAQGGSVIVFKMWEKPAMVINDATGQAIVSCVDDGCHVLPHGDLGNGRGFKLDDTGSP